MRNKTILKNWLPRQRPSSDRLYSHTCSSTNPENLAKIDPVDFEITDLAEIVRNINIYNKKQQQNMSPPVAVAAGRNKTIAWCCIFSIPTATPHNLLSGPTKYRRL